MTSPNRHTDHLKKSNNWIDYLKENSGLPGKKAIYLRKERLLPNYANRLYWLTKKTPILCLNY